MNLLNRLADRFSYLNRNCKSSFALKYIERKQINSILVVGAVPSRSESSFANLIEEGLAQKGDKFLLAGSKQRARTGLPGFKQMALRYRFKIGNLI